MVQINFAKREVQCKVVYYGPARSGKTANLRSVHDRTPETVRGKLTSMATDTNRTLFFDFLPLDLGNVAGIHTKIHLYAVPYIDRQNAMRLLVLEGVDGVVFVADASRTRREENREALGNLRENLRALGREIDDVPLVWQFNKSDLPDALPVAELNQALNPEGRPAFAAAAEIGTGVFSTLKVMTQAVLVNVTKALGPVSAAAPEAASADADTEEIPRPEPEPQPEPPEEPPVEVDQEKEPTYNPPWRQGKVPIRRRDPEPLPAFEEIALPEPRQAPEPVPVAAAVPETPAAPGAPAARPARVRTPPRAMPAAPVPDRGAGTWESLDRSERTARIRRSARIAPVVDRREHPRINDPYRRVPARQFAAGAALTFVSLITIGFLVYILL